MLFLIFSLFASAQTPSSTATLPQVLENKKFEDTREITDAKLKAESGSLSRYSLKFNLSYYGPTLNDVTVADQPNPDGAVIPSETSLGGSMSGRLRLSPETALGMGTGIKVIHPFHGMDRFDVNNPYLTYDIASRNGSVQYRNSFGMSAITIPTYTKVGEWGSLSYDNSVVMNLGTSGFATGFDTSFGYYLYNRAYRRQDRNSTSYSLSLFPNVKYNFSDRLSVNTSIALSWWNPRSRDESWAMWNKTVSQRLGLGYGIRRDIYFAPYLNFYPQRLTSDSTTVNFSTIFSLL